MSRAIIPGIILLLAVAAVSGQTVPSNVMNHVISKEGGVITTGYIPTSGSGVTIGAGIDLGQNTPADLKAAGVSPSIIAKVQPYIGPQTRAQVAAAGLKASDLKLTKAEATAISQPIIQKSYSAVKSLTSNMDSNGAAVLTSIKHWNNNLACTSCSKLTKGTGTNYLWNTIKGGTATNAQLKDALTKTLQGQAIGTGAYNRINAEIDQLNSGSTGSSCQNKRSADSSASSGSGGSCDDSQTSSTKTSSTATSSSKTSSSEKSSSETSSSQTGSATSETTSESSSTPSSGQSSDSSTQDSSSSESSNQDSDQSADDSSPEDYSQNTY